jgi:hypothetical protein
MATRTSKLGASRPAAGINTTLFTVPANMTYIVKGVLVSNVVGPDDTVTVSIVQDGITFVYLLHGATVATGATTRLTDQVVLSPGDKMNFLSTGGVSVVWVTGTKLVGVA